MAEPFVTETTSAPSCPRSASGRLPSGGSLRANVRAAVQRVLQAPGHLRLPACRSGSWCSMWDRLKPHVEEIRNHLLGKE